MADLAPSEITADWLDTVGPGGWLMNRIDDDLTAAETMFLGLRLLDGLDVAEASRRLGTDLAARYRTPLSDLVDLGLLVREDTVYRLHPSAYLIANQVFERFLE